MRDFKGRFINGLVPWNKSTDTTTDRTCTVCGEKFHESISRVKSGKGKFCSKKCFYKGRELKGTFQKGHPIIGGAHSMPHTEATKNKLRLIQREKNKDRLPNIIGQIKKGLSRAVRDSFQWKDWRKTVFERDHYTCKECGKRGGYLEPHHIVPIKRDRTLLFTIKNGITLCRPCHKRTMGKEHLFEEKYSSMTA